MTTTEPSDEDIERSVRSEPAQDVLDAEKPLTAYFEEDKPDD